VGLSGVRLLLRGRACRPHDYLWLMLFGPIARQYFLHAATTSPDLPVFLLGILIGVQLFKVLFADEAGPKLVFDTFLIIVLSVIGVAVKLSFVVLGGTSSLIALVILVVRRRRERGAASYSMKWGWLVAPALLVVVPWMVRGVILSGYVAYPSSHGGLSVEWRIPRGAVVSFNRVMKAWDRRPGIPAAERVANQDEALVGWAWVPRWTKHTVRRCDVTMPLLLLIAGTVVFSARRRNTGSRPVLNVLLLLPFAASVVFLFLTIPCPRYFGASLWFLGVGTLFLASGRWLGSRRPGLVLLLMFVLAVLIVVPGNLGRQRLFVEPGSKRGFHPIPVMAVHPFRTRSGLTVYVPNEGNQAWDAALPNTPYPNPDLRLRKKGAFRHGFMIR